MYYVGIHETPVIRSPSEILFETATCKTVKMPKNWSGDGQNCLNTPKNLGRRRPPQNGPPVATLAFSMYVCRYVCLF